MSRAPPWRFGVEPPLPSGFIVPPLFTKVWFAIQQNDPDSVRDEVTAGSLSHVQLYALLDAAINQRGSRAPEFARILLDAGADPDHPDEFTQSTQFHHAAVVGSWPLFKVIAEVADHSLRDVYLQTPVRAALTHENYEIVHRWDAHVRGEIAQYVAASQDNARTGDALLRYWANAHLPQSCSLELVGATSIPSPALLRKLAVVTLALRDPSFASLPDLQGLRALELRGSTPMTIGRLPDSLESLTLEGCTSLRDVRPGAPLLRKLVIHTCPKLESIPWRSSLESLEVRDAPGVKAQAERIQSLISERESHRARGALAPVASLSLARARAASAPAAPGGERGRRSTMQP